MGAVVIAKIHLDGQPGGGAWSGQVVAPLDRDCANDAEYATATTKRGGLSPVEWC